MAVPVLSHTAQRLYDALAPLAESDEANDWALAVYCQAVASPLDEVADLSRDADEDGAPGWTQIFDLDTIAEKYLPWIGQFVGVTLPETLAVDAKRLRIREMSGFKRGTPAAIKGAARQFLTDTKTVYLVERHGSAYRLTISTYDSETPDNSFADLLESYDTFDALISAFDDFDEIVAPSRRITNALREQVPAGIVFEHRIINPGTFDELRDSHTDFDHVTNVYVNFAEVLVNPTKTWDYAELASVSTDYDSLASTFTDYNDLQTD